MVNGECVWISPTLASSLTKEVPWLIKVEVVQKPSIDVKVNVSIVMVSKPCWMDPIIDFLAKDRVPNNEKEAEKNTQNCYSVLVV